MCVWCRGISLGDITKRHCALDGAYFGFVELTSILDRLWAIELEGLDDVALWNFLDGKLYGYHGDVEVQDDRTVEDCDWDWKRWGDFNFLTNWGEQFDGYKAFVACPPNEKIWILASQLRKLSISREGLVAAVEGFSRWFEDECWRLQGNNADPMIQRRLHFRRT